MIEIDYVVPMVFDDDALWREDFNRVVKKTDDPARWRSWGLERLHIASIAKFMPFVRTIYILLARESQIQPWMKEFPKVRVVLHKEFIPERYLPCFNASAIEMYLHNIPDLSEYFIYGNDDFFVVSPLETDDFFFSGLPCQHHEETELPFLLTDFQYMCKAELNLVARPFGRRFTNTVLDGGHSFSAIRKSTCLKVWSMFGNEMEASVTPCGREDRNFNQYIYSFWQHLSGEYVNKVPKSVFTSINMPKERIVELILRDDAKIIIINDNETDNDYKEYMKVVKEALEKRIN